MPKCPTKQTKPQRKAAQKASVYNVTVHYQTKYKTQTNDAGCF